MPVLLDEVFDDRARFGDGVLSVGDDRRLAERMDLLQLGRREAGRRIALVVADLVRNLELLEKPEHALRAGVVQVMDNDHAAPWNSFSKRGSGQSQIAATSTYSPKAIHGLTSASATAAR